jgi:hypothetical protein
MTDPHLSEEVRPESDPDVCAEHRTKPGQPHKWRRGRRGRTREVTCNPPVRWCGHEWDKVHPAAMGWKCTLPEGHIGYHVAHDLDGSICATTEPRIRNGTRGSE